MRRACLWPCLAGLARPESLRRRGRVCRRLRKLVGAYPTALVWPARLRRTAVGAPAFFRSKRCGIRCFLSPRLESERSLGWGRGLSGEKSLLQSEKCIKMIKKFCQISLFDKIDADTPKFLLNWVWNPSGPRIATSLDSSLLLSLSGFFLLERGTCLIASLYPQRNLSQAPDLWSKVGCG